MLIIEKRSTCGATLSLVNALLTGLDNSFYNAVLSLDLAKAFDTVPHNFLIQKLTWYGFRGKIQMLIKSYLENRSQYVAIEDACSTKGTITCGVPQGAILSPFLFILFINDMPLSLSKTHIYQYADDTNLMISGKYLTQTINDLQTDTNKLTLWLSRNNLVLNEEKCQLMLVTSPQKNIPHFASLKINSTEISLVPTIKFLGLLIDSHLKWDKHIQLVTNKLMIVLRKFYQLHCILPKQLLLTIYFAFVQPYISYCLESWGNSYHTHLHKIFLLQKRFLRIIEKKTRYEPSAPLFISNNILSVYAQVIFQTMITAIKLKKQLTFIPNLEIRSTSIAYNTREASKPNQLHLPSPATNYGKFAFLYRGPFIWNILIPYININNPVNTIKHDLKHYLSTLTVEKLIETFYNY
jgi:hypothetical protein